MTEFFISFWNIREQVLSLLFDHIQLTILSVGIAVLIGIPVGILISHSPALSRPVLGMTNLVQAIPSLAMLGFLIPYLGIGTAPAIFCVVIYSLLPIIKNTCIGLNNIDPDTLEAAKGIGMTKGQVMRKVQFPLALPVIMAGIRIAAVNAVGFVTIAAFIGAGGLGYLVYSGIQTSNTNLILSGAIPACILALLVDFIVGFLEKVVTPVSLMNPSADMTKEKVQRNKRKRGIVSVSALVITIAIIAASVAPNYNQKGKVIHVGSKNFTEQLILGNMYADLIEDKTDIRVVRDLNLGSTDITYNALKNHDIDMYVEYTGTAYGSLLDQGVSTDKEHIYSTVCKLMEKQGIRVLDPIGFNNSFVLAVRENTAEKYHLKTISDLKKVSSQLVFSPTIEFNNRNDGIVALNNAYNLKFKALSPIEGGLGYTAIDSGKCDVLTAYSTDGLLKTYHLKILEDDKNAMLSYYAIPMINESTLLEYPELEEVLSKMTGLIDDETMRSLNYLVDQEGKTPESVARDFLKSKGLL
ncbi:MAG: Osmoprotectant transport system permease protein [Eubacteriales bacterium]|jgi:osmoprotectant transport system permease protein